MDTTSPAAAPPATEPAKEPQTKPAKAKAKAGKKKGSCLKSCFVVVVLLLLGLGWLVASAFGLPRKWGLVKAPVDKMYTTEDPDRSAAAEVSGDMEKAGFPMKGTYVAVLPRRDGSGAAAYAVLDASEGFTFEEGDPVLGTLTKMAKSQAIKDNGIDRVAFEYRDEKGRRIVTIGAKTQDAIDFADGKLTQDDFIGRIGGRIEIKGLMDAQRDSFK